MTNSGIPKASFPETPVLLGVNSSSETSPNPHQPDQSRPPVGIDRCLPVVIPPKSPATLSPDPRLQTEFKFSPGDPCSAKKHKQTVYPVSKTVFEEVSYVMSPPGCFASGQNPSPPSQSNVSTLRVHGHPAPGWGRLLRRRGGGSSGADVWRSWPS